jgi:hypothetical protein
VSGRSDHRARLNHDFLGVRQAEQADVKRMRQRYWISTKGRWYGVPNVPVDDINKCDMRVPNFQRPRAFRPRDVPGPLARLRSPE